MPEDYKVQVSLSAPPAAQFAKGAMINFRGSDVHEVFAQLDAAAAVGLLEKASEVESVWNAATTLGARTESVQPSPGGWQEGAPSAQPQWSQPAQQSGPPAPMCQHGKRTWKTGNGAKGAWYAWFCPAAKGDPTQCDAVWAKSDGSPRD